MTRCINAKHREDRTDALCSNDIWAKGFVHDQLAIGRKLRFLTVIGQRYSYCGEDAVAKLDRVCHWIGYFKTNRVDDGNDFISLDMDIGAYQCGVTLDFSGPGKPTDNAFIEAFSTKLRVDCLNTKWLISGEDVCKKMEAWLRCSSDELAHNAIGNIPR